MINIVAQNRDNPSVRLRKGLEDGTEGKVKGTGYAPVHKRVRRYLEKEDKNGTVNDAHSAIEGDYTSESTGITA